MLLKELLDVCVSNQMIKISYFDGSKFNDYIKPSSVLKYEIESLLDNEITCIYSSDNVLNVIL